VLEELADAQALVFSFPFYAYSMPAALTKFLEELYLHLRRRPPREQPADHELVQGQQVGQEVHGPPAAAAAFG
jgi:putative NADPH-quinone reductase